MLRTVVIVCSYEEVVASESWATEFASLASTASYASQAVTAEVPGSGFKLACARKDYRSFALHSQIDLRDISSPLPQPEFSSCSLRSTKQATG